MDKVDIRDDGTTLDIRVGVFQTRNLPTILFLCFWLCGWSFGEFFVLLQIFGDTHWTTKAFLLVWLTFWTIGGSAVILSVIRMVGGGEQIEVGRGLMRISRSYVFFRQTKTYDIFRIHDLRMDTLKQYRLNPFNNGLFRFDYDGKEIRFGAGLKGPDQAKIWQHLERHTDLQKALPAS